MNKKLLIFAISFQPESFVKTLTVGAGLPAPTGKGGQ
jgi:hypothetical protein